MNRGESQAFALHRRAVERDPQLLQDADGQTLTLEACAQAVHMGAWRAPSVGPARLRKIGEALAEAGAQA